MTQEKILQNLAFGQIALTLATIIFHCYLGTAGMRDIDANKIYHNGKL